MSENLYKRRSALKADASEVKVKIGGWFEAQATGWGIAAVPCIVVLVIGAGVLVRLVG